MGKYGFSQALYLFQCLIRTRLFFRGARLIRFPIDVRGKSGIDFGRGLTTGRNCRLEALGKGKTIFFGDGIEVNDMVHITGSEAVRIGNHVLIASKVYISDTAHGLYSGDGEHSSPDEIPNKRTLRTKPVVIEDRVWIGESVSILPGVCIGQGSIIGANSVVTKDVPELCIAAGAPARVIKRYNPSNKKWEAVR